MVRDVPSRSATEKLGTKDALGVEERNDTGPVCRITTVEAAPFPK